MREEIKNWLKQSEEDLEKAEILFKNKKYDGVAFNCHQSVEKAQGIQMLLEVSLLG